MPLSLAWLHKIVSEVDGRLPAQAMDKLQGPIAAWLRKLSPSETLSERTFEHCVSPSPKGDRRDKALHPSQIAAGDPSTFLRKEKTSKLGRMIGMDLRTVRLAIAKGDRTDRPCTSRRSQITTIRLFHGNRRSAQ